MSGTQTILHVFSLLLCAAVWYVVGRFDGRAAAYKEIRERYLQQRAKADK